MEKTVRPKLLVILPMMLIVFRALLAPFVILWAYFFPSNAGLIIVIACALAIVSDIYDGIIARNLNIATERIRLLDCYADLIFWLAAAWCVWVLHPNLVKANWILVAILISQEPISDLIYLLRFRKDGCSHTYLSKFWGLTLLTTFVLIFGFNNYMSFIFCVIIGIISQWERIAIAIVLPARICDIPTVFHAIQLKNGIPIKRNKLFHGETKR